MTNSLGGTDLGYVQTDRIIGNTGVSVISGATGDSSQSEAVKLVNSTRGFEVSGIVTGSQATLQAFATQLTAWLDGVSDTAAKYTYVSILHGTCTVTVTDGDGEYVAGSPSKYVYNLSLKRVAA